MTTTLFTILERLEQKQSSLASIEEKYINKKKGEVYYQQTNYHKNYIRQLEKELEEFGKSKINIWGVTLGYKEVSTRIEIALPDIISSSEIFEYYRIVRQLDVETVELVKQHKIGFFPRTL
jgi:hypothetical protein